MQNSGGSVSRNSNLPSLRVALPQQSLRRLGLCSQIATATGSPVVFPEKQKRSKAKVSGSAAAAEDAHIQSIFEHKIDIGVGDEKSNLLGYDVFLGKLVLDKGKAGNVNADASLDKESVNARLTSKALIWGSHMLAIEDVISVRSLLFFYQ